MRVLRYLHAWTVLLHPCDCRQATLLENVTPLPELTQAHAAEVRGSPAPCLERGLQWGQVGALSRSDGWLYCVQPLSHTPAGPCHRPSAHPPVERAREQCVTMSSCSGEGLQTSDTQRATLISQEVGDRCGGLCAQGQAYFIQYKEWGEA